MNKSEPNDYKMLAMEISNLTHGGNIYTNSKKLKTYLIARHYL